MNKMIDVTLIGNWMYDAQRVAENSYSPYSNFKVGCVVLTHSGKLFYGTNVENGSLGLTICAERMAIGAAITAGYKDIRAVIIYGPTESVPPCGACRQFILEFGDDIIVAFKYQGKIVQKTVLELLPLKFIL